MVRLLLAASAEVDVVMKQLCKAINPESTASSINAYQAEILNIQPNFKEFEVTVPRYGLTLKPWTDWGDNHPPFWWQDHNKVKHHRHKHFEKGNLKNCLNSIAALYISVLYLYQQQVAEGELLQRPRLFNVADKYFGGTQVGRYGHSFKYNLL